MMKRILSLILVCFTLALSLCSCGGESGGESTATDPSVQGTEKEHLDNLPADLDFQNQELYVLYSSFNGDADIKTKDVEGDAEGDTVDSSVFSRNLAVEDRLNLDLIFMEADETGPKAYSNLVDTLYLNNDSTYDVIYHYGQHAATQSMKGYFRAWNNVPHLDLNADYWYLDQMTNLSLNLNTQYMLIGDLVISNFTNMNAIFFNKEDYEKYFPEAEKSLYQMVYDGEWTWENYFAIIEEVYSDNGDGIVGEGDYFGAHYESGYRTGVYYPYGCGLLYTSRDENGFLQLNFNNQQTGNMVEKLYQFVNSKTFTMNMDSFTEAKPAFLAEKMLFWAIFLGQAKDIKAQATFEWGILPFPKLDSTVDHNTSVAKGAGVYVIPKTTAEDRLPMVGAALEALCSHSSQKVIPYYYEYILKANQAGNPEDSAMIDFLRDHLWFDCMFWIGNGVGEIDVIFRNVIFTNDSSNFSGHWASYGFVYETLLDNLIIAYEKSISEEAVA